VGNKGHWRLGGLGVGPPGYNDGEFGQQVSARAKLLGKLPPSALAGRRP